MARGTVNKVIILGRLGQDPDVRTTASGTQVVNLSVATNELGRADEQGNRQDVTEWHRIVLFGKTAEVASQYLNKGSQVYIEGRLQTRKWQDQDGNDRYSTEIVGYEMQFIGGKSDGSALTHDASPSAYQKPQQPQQGGFHQPQQGGFQQQAPAQQPTQQAPAQPAAGGVYGMDDDSIPF